MKNVQGIRVLSERVANQIAAGEVVDRPASVLKELLENALDAEATQIDAEIVKGGRTLIRVGDNGVGMGRDDALLSIERFATSKIRDVSELERVATLGFRGEALAAISSVSRFNLCTRRAQDLAGTEIIMSGGRIQDVRDQGCAPGTVVSVRNLFFNVPARRKFLRSQQTEVFHARQVFTLYALSNPDTALTLVVDGRQTANLPGHADLDQRLRDLYPSDFFNMLRPVNYQCDLLSVSGYAGLPTHSRADRAEQHLFVNGRPAGAAVLAAAVREAYRGLLPRDRYPVLFLFISTDPSLVDVNVHPAKKEIRFHNPTGVRSAVIESIRRAISAGPAPAAPVFAGASSYRGPAAGELFKGAQKFPYPRSPFSDSLPAEKGVDERQADKTETGEAPESHRPPPWSRMRLLGQVCGLYVVMETEEGLVLMDPHAAHERVLYEQLMSEVIAGSARGHGLLLPETVEFAPGDAQVLRSHLETLKKMGFGIAEFGGDVFVVDALPACLSGVSPAGLLTDVAAVLERAGEKAGVEMLLEERIAQAACKSAVKAQKTFSPEEIESLVEQLARAEMPYTCPHGRPTLIHIAREELDRKFGRV